tara:strand:- start:2511 stop:3392 length:882 start_codon:yes stop_codon:yes gene_type:complete
MITEEIEVYQGMFNLDKKLVNSCCRERREILAIDPSTLSSMLLNPIEFMEMIEMDNYVVSWKPDFNAKGTKLIQHLNPQWYSELKDEFDKDYMKKVSVYIQNARKKTTVYPSSDNVFRALRLTSPYRLNVLILGQDPYHDGSADGLAFSATSKGVYVPPSLKKIMENIEFTVDGELPNALNRGNDLRPWAAQGVLLLNTSLTVEKGKPNSHKGVWDDFVKQVINKATSMNQMVIMLWGTHAKSFKKYIVPNKHLILEAYHPAYSVRRNEAWKHNHFLEANKFLMKKKNIEIKW